MVQKLILLSMVVGVLAVTGCASQGMTLQRGQSTTSMSQQMKQDASAYYAPGTTIRTPSGTYTVPGQVHRQARSQPRQPQQAVKPETHQQASSSKASTPVVASEEHTRKKKKKKIQFRMWTGG